MDAWREEKAQVDRMYPKKGPTCRRVRAVNEANTARRIAQAQERIAARTLTNAEKEKLVHLLDTYVIPQTRTQSDKVADEWEVIRYKLLQVQPIMPDPRVTVEDLKRAAGFTDFPDPGPAGE